MPDYRRLIIVVKDGKEILRGGYEEVADYLGVSTNRIYQKLSTNGIFIRDGEEYTVIRTNEKLPKRKDIKEHPSKPKKKYTIAQINQMAKKAKMSYGQYVATMR